MHEFLKHLVEDHEKQKQLGSRLSSTSDGAEREKLRNEFYEELYPHMIGEEASIFKKLKESGEEEMVDDALEGLQEHHVGKLVLKELMELNTDSEVFKAKAKVLDEMNRHHIEEEEKDIFKHLQKICTDEELSALFEKYENAESDAK